MILILKQVIQTTKSVMFDMYAPKQYIEKVKGIL